MKDQRFHVVCHWFYDTGRQNDSRQNYLSSCLVVGEKTLGLMDGTFLTLSVWKYDYERQSDSLWRHTRSLMGTFVQSYSISDINTVAVFWRSHCQEVITDPCTFHATAKFFDCLVCCWVVFFFFQKNYQAPADNLSLMLELFSAPTDGNVWVQTVPFFFFFLLLHNKSRADTCLRGSAQILKVL